jgi:mannosylglycoprotein endo-beta-mannosidase
MRKSRLLILCVLALPFLLHAQRTIELNSAWKCQAIDKIHVTPDRLSLPAYALDGWLDATVPGTVLTTLINNRLAPDPFYGLNNQQIPDIYTTGRDRYTYWFVRNFRQDRAGEGQVWLDFRGVNYGCDVWLNGHRLNDKTHYGMFLRQSYNITAYLNANGENRLAVLVYPPDPPGNPNGGQGGDGEIARNVSHQYVAGWDWIQPIADRNTGIWDKVTLHTCGSIRIRNPHIVTDVPGTRYPDDRNQAPAYLHLTAELQNSSPYPRHGTLYYELEGHEVSIAVSVAGRSTAEVTLPVDTLLHPRLWWPNGYGAQPLYATSLVFSEENADGSGAILVNHDVFPVTFGIRNVTTSWNTTTRSRQVEVNGQRIFIKGGNWIVSDELLRFSPERYDAEVRFHRDMNLNLIRVWGGALTERPEFYAACDRYGLLVFQDFWNSGDCNGRWEDPRKKADQWTRRQYPDDHRLFLASVADQVKLLRNHPSLAFWCGGNEITPPDDILRAMKETILPALDPTRAFIDYSNSDSLSYNTLGGNGDGPYGIQPLSTFWAKRSFPFNSEVGSVGMGDYESLERFIPQDHLVPPGKEDEIWAYHKYIGYDSTIYAYGAVKDLRDFARKAQLVNYDQYRGLMEGFSAHMWDWYTGVIIWKTQNPWTALRGQMYDYYLDPNACLYGLHCGSAPLHVMYDPVSGMTMIANNTFRTQRDLMMQVIVTDMAGQTRRLTQQFFEVGPTTAKSYLPIGRGIDRLRAKEGLFMTLRLVNTAHEIISDNLYWLPDSTGLYSGLQHMNSAALAVEAVHSGTSHITVTLSNPAGGPLAFFNRISLVDPATKQRLLPVFYSDNYVSVLPGESKTVTLEYTPRAAVVPQVSVSGWNVEEKLYPVK